MGSTQPRVKGVAFRTIEACYAELRGTDARDQARQLMPSELGDLYRAGLMLAASWYPIDWYRDALQAFRAATKEGPELARNIGYQAVKRDMTSVYKSIFAKIVSPAEDVRLQLKSGGRDGDTSMELEAHWT